jgi:hypothetical protein
LRFLFTATGHTSVPSGAHKWRILRTLVRHSCVSDAPPCDGPPGLDPDSGPIVIAPLDRGSRCPIATCYVPAMFSFLEIPQSRCWWLSQTATVGDRSSAIGSGLGWRAHSALAVIALNVVHARQRLVRYCLLAEHFRWVGARPVKASVAAGFAGCSLDRPRPPGTLASNRQCRRTRLTLTNVRGNDN